MAVGYGCSRGVTILPMTDIAREFVLSGISQQPSDISPRLTKENVGKVIVTQFAQSEIQVEIEGDLNQRDVIIFFSNEPPINERIAELRLVMQIAKRSSADRITVIAPQGPYTRGEKQDQHHVSVAFKDFADSLNFYGACFITCDMHDPVAIEFFNTPHHMISLRQIAIEVARKIPGITVAVSADAGGVKRVRKYAKVLELADGRYIDKVVIDKQRTGNDDNAMAERCYGADVKGKDVIIIDDEAMTLGTLISATKVLKDAGAKSVYAFAYHGVLAGPAIERLAASEIDQLIVTNTVPVSDEKLTGAKGKLHVIDVSAFVVEAARRWYAGDSLKTMKEYAYKN